MSNEFLEHPVYVQLVSFGMPEGLPGDEQAMWLNGAFHGYARRDAERFSRILELETENKQLKGLLNEACAKFGHTMVSPDPDTSDYVCTDWCLRCRIEKLGEQT